MLAISFSNKLEIISLYTSIAIVCTQLIGFKYHGLTLIILFNIYSFAHSEWLQILLCITFSSIKQQSFVYTQLNGKIVLFLTIQFNTSHLFAHSFNVKHFYLTHRSGATNPNQSEHGSSDNKEVFHIPQRYRTWASPTNDLMSYLGHTLVEGGLNPLQRCSRCILLPQPTGLRV